MPRSRLTDFLQDSFFWAFDGSGTQEMPVFSPLFGFSSISAPEISVELESFKDGTFQFQRHVVKGAEAGAVTFARAASPFDSDFYEWISYAINGSRAQSSSRSLSKIATGFLGDKGGFDTWRRNILVLQFTAINPANVSGTTGVVASLAAAGLVGGSLLSGAGRQAVAVGAVGAVGAWQGVGPFEFASRLPARGWMLYGCVPTNYRAASDFEANSGDISIVELEIQPEHIEEFSLGVKP
jgi:phage tail-like protein